MICQDQHIIQDARVVNEAAQRNTTFEGADSSIIFAPNRTFRAHARLLLWLQRNRLYQQR